MLSGRNFPLLVDSTGKQTNPTAAGDALADTGAIDTKLSGGGGIYEVTAVVGASAAAIFEVQHRNVANDANASDPVVLYVAAGDSAQAVVHFHISNGERVRIKMNADLTGTAAGHLSVQRVG